MKKKLVTIGIPCFNCATHLPALLRSLSAQLFDEWEAIAIDDASTDGTAELLRSLRHPRIRVVLGKENSGLGPRLNEIHTLAQTEFVARTDADDLMHPNRLRRQMECFRANPELDVCATGSYTIDNRNRLLGVRRVPPLAATPREVMLRNGPSHPTITARREWFLRFPYVPSPKRGQDLDLWIRSAPYSRIVQLDEPLHFIREDPAFDLGKYRRSMQDHRVHFRRHARLVEDPIFAVYVQAKSYAKECGYQALNWMGLAERIVARRNLPTTAEQRRETDAFLARIGAKDLRSEEWNVASPLAQEAQIPLREIL